MLPRIIKKKKIGDQICREPATAPPKPAGMPKAALAIFRQSLKRCPTYDWGVCATI